MNSKTKGFIYGAIAAASYGMNPLFALPLYAAGMSVDTVLFYRYFFAVIVLGILMKMQHQSFALRKADILPLIIMDRRMVGVCSGIFRWDCHLCTANKLTYMLM